VTVSVPLLTLPFAGPVLDMSSILPCHPVASPPVTFAVSVLKSSDNDEVDPAFLHSAPTFSLCRAGLTT
jgi:hypothetical protein